MSNRKSAKRCSVRRNLLPAVCLCALFGSRASATSMTFTSEDLGVGPGSAAPNSAVSAASFYAAAAALGPVSIITFENSPIGSFSSLNVAPGVALSGADAIGGYQSILNSPAFPANPSLAGFNTTPGGANYASMDGGSLVFDFSTPTQFFGAYLSGIQTYFYQDTVTLTLSDGSTQVMDVPGIATSGSKGALDFVGVTEPGASISSVAINAGMPSSGYDAIGVDDVQYQGQNISVTPEPSSLLLVSTGLLGTLGVLRKRFAKIA